MVLPTFHDLRSSARKSLDTAQNPKRIIFIHTGVVLLLSFLLALVDYLLEQQIGSTGGLSGIGTRSMLETAQSVLQLARNVALPFWQMGYIFYTLKVAQGTDVGVHGLFEGFRRFGAVLRLKMLTAGLLFLVMMASSYLSSTIFLLTPWSDSLLETLAPMFSGTMDETAIMDIYESIPLSSIAPMMIIFVICLIVLAVPIYYRYRMADLWLMDHPDRGAFAALRSSRKMMRGNCLWLFKIDLHFLWFFVLDLLITLVCYGDLLLSSLGIALPFDETVAYFLFFAVYLLLQMGLYLWKQNDICVTYAHVYESLKPTEEEIPRTPWSAVV